jgi:hypothetical protein
MRLYRPLRRSGRGGVPSERSSMTHDPNKDIRADPIYAAQRVSDMDALSFRMDHAAKKALSQETKATAINLRDRAKKAALDFDQYVKGSN